MTEEEFDASIEDVDWAEVYERQVARGGLVTRYCDLLGITAGDDVLELGSGPGYTTVELAGAVAPGSVYALDRHEGALRYLRDEVGGELSHVHLVVGDVQSLPVRFAEPTAALAAFVLHHVEGAERAVQSVWHTLAPGSPFLVVEYHPDAPEEFGPPTDHRIAPDTLDAWLTTAGFTTEAPTTLPEEKYAIVARR